MRALRAPPGAVPGRGRKEHSHHLTTGVETEVRTANSVGTRMDSYAHFTQGLMAVLQPSIPFVVRGRSLHASL